MTQPNKHPKNIRNSLRNKAATIGAIAVALPGVMAQSAAAQTGGTKAPTAPVPAATSPSGGIEAPNTSAAEADQTLNLQAQQARSDLAVLFLSLSDSHNTAYTPLLDAQGNNLTSTTITIPAKDPKGHNDGQYKFNVVSENEPDGTPQLDNVLLVTASEGLIAKKGEQNPSPEASIRIGLNPSTNTAEVSGTYHVYPPKGAVISSEGNYKSIAAGVQSVAPGALQTLTAAELGAVETQMSGLAESATQGQAIHRLDPAFNQQGFTINDPAN
jgi:hypothetical protein